MKYAVKIMMHQISREFFDNCISISSSAHKDQRLHASSSLVHINIAACSNQDEGPKISKEIYLFYYVNKKKRKRSTLR